MRFPGAGRGGRAKLPRLEVAVALLAAVCFIGISFSHSEERMAAKIDDDLDWFAGMALTGLLSADAHSTSVATRAYGFADAMIAERAKRAVKRIQEENKAVQSRATHKSTTRRPERTNPPRQ
jgi:hypothetical protein